MTSCTYNCFMNVINIGNSIIGVSILAMPYCFRRCGILLSMALIFVSGILTRIACYLLLKSAIKARRRNFEFLAFHTFGPSGKLSVEMSVIGFLIGVCIAFFVVIGDLGPPLASEFLEIENSPNLRTNVLMLVGLCVALPLGMLRKIDSLTSLSALSIAFYVCLILKIFAEAVPNLAANEWWYEVNWWKTEGLLPCLPIFSMALSCQTQLFEFFDTLNDPSLKRMQSVISGAVHLCSTVYILVGTLGYIAFYNKMISGNILVFLTPSVITEIIKLGFIITVAVSFPLCLFPCRSSLHSLLFKQGFGHHETNVTVIPEARFRILTISLVIVTIGIAIMLPNIEFVLGFVGSTIGTLICLIFPALIFISDISKNTTEKRLAQILMGIGVFMFVACTYSTLQEDHTRPVQVSEQIKNIIKMTPNSQLITSSIAAENQSPIPPLKQEINIIIDKDKKNLFVDKPPEDQKRLEPPIPQEPESKAEQNADLDPQALQKEDKELLKENPPPSNAQEVSKKDKNMVEKQEKLLQKLEEQHKEQKIILEQQKKVLEELKLHQESHDEQKKADQKTVAPQMATDNVPQKEIKQEQLLKPVTKAVEVKNTNKNLKQPIPVEGEKRIDFNIKNKSGVVPNVGKTLNNPNDHMIINRDSILASEDLGIKTLPEKPNINKTLENLKPPQRKENIVPEGKNLPISDFPITKAPVRAKTENDFQKRSDAHINKREPLEEKKIIPDGVILSGTNKEVKINDVLLGHEKLPA